MHVNTCLHKSVLVSVCRQKSNKTNRGAKAIASAPRASLLKKTIRVYCTSPGVKVGAKPLLTIRSYTFWV